jgi:hypothetical protein
MQRKNKISKYKRVISVCINKPTPLLSYVKGAQIAAIKSVALAHTHKQHPTQEQLGSGCVKEKN